MSLGAGSAPAARRRATSKPLSSPRSMSTRVTSGRSAPSCSIASRLVDATPTTSRPSRSRAARAAARKSWLSSTIRRRTHSASQPGSRSASLLAGIFRAGVDRAEGLPQEVRASGKAQGSAGRKHRGAKGGRGADTRAGNRAEDDRGPVRARRRWILVHEWRADQLERLGLSRLVVSSHLDTEAPRCPEPWYRLTGTR